MIHFVIAQTRFYGKTLDRNIRLGGYRILANAEKAAVREAPAFIKDIAGKIVGQTIDPAFPRYIR